MKTTPFLAQLKYAFAGPDWPCLLPALRQEAQIWQALSTSDLGTCALKVLPPELARWSPEVLSLLAGAIGSGKNNVSVADGSAVEKWKMRFAVDPSALTLSDEETVPAREAYETWRQASETPLNLAQAGWIARMIISQAQDSAPWAWLVDEPGLQPKGGESHHNAGLILACLYGLSGSRSGSSFEFLSNGLSKGIQPSLLIHAFLCNPAREDAQAGLLLTLLDSLPEGQAVAALQAISQQRPRLASSLARVFGCSSVPAGEVVSDEQCNTGQFLDQVIAGKRDTNVSSLTGAIVQLSQSAQVHHLAGQPAGAIPLLAEAIRSSRRLQGQLSAQLARILASSRELDQDHPESLRKRSIEAWRQAVQMAPGASAYSAGLALALVDAGRLDDASNALQAHLAKAGSAPNPGLLLASALQAQRAGQIELARQAALRALESAENGTSSESAALDLEGARRLGLYFWQEGMLPETERAFKLGLALSPNDPELSWLAAQTYAKLGQHVQALDMAYTVQVGAEPDFNPGEVKRLQIDCLEALEAWNLAMQERQELVEAAEHPDAGDLRALAQSALRAGSAERVIGACNRAIASGFGSQAWVHQYLGEAALELVDYPLAAEHLRQAARLAPAQPVLWLKLAQTYQLLGQPVQAVDVLRLASQAAPNSPQIHMALGKAYRDQQAYTQALGCFRKAARLDPSPDARLNLGQVLYELGHLQEARHVLESSVDVAPPSNGANGSPEDKQMNLAMKQTYAQVLLALGETSKAVMLLEDVVCAEPENLQANLDLATGLMKNNPNLGAAQQAIPLLERVLEKDSVLSRPEEQVAQALIAEAQSVMGDNELALQAYNRILTTPLAKQPGWRARLALGLGRVALAVGQPELALAALQDAARAEPLNLHLRARHGGSLPFQPAARRCFHNRQGNPGNQPIGSEYPDLVCWAGSTTG